MTDLVRKLPKYSALRKLTDFDRKRHPSPPEPVLPNEDELQRKARQESSKRAQQSGRLSTFLSQPTDTLGP